MMSTVHALAVAQIVVLTDAGVANIDILAADDIDLTFLMMLINMGRTACCPAHVLGRKALTRKFCVNDGKLFFTECCQGDLHGPTQSAAKRSAYVHPHRHTAIVCHHFS